MHAEVFQDMSANEQRSAACMSSWQFLFAEAVFAGSGTLQGRHRHRLCPKLRLMSSSLLASSALQYTGWVM